MYLAKYIIKSKAAEMSPKRNQHQHLPVLHYPTNSYYYIMFSTYNLIPILSHIIGKSKKKIPTPGKE